MDIHSEIKRSKKDRYTQRAFCLFAAALMLLAFSPLRAEGAELKIIPSVSLMGAYNDNVYLTPEYQISSWLVSATPGITLLGRTEKFDVSLSARGKFDYYLGTDDSKLKDYYLLSGTPITGDTSLNSISQYYNAVVGYTFTPSFRMTANAGWVRDYQPDRDLMDTGLTMGDYKRDRFSAGVNGIWSLTEKWSMGLGYNFGRDVYDSPGMSDLTTHSANAFLNYIVSPKTTARLNAGYGHYYYTLTTQDTNMFWGTLGIEHRFHELWTISVDGGGRFARSQFPYAYSPSGPFANVTSSNWGGIFRTSLNYADDKNRVTLTFNYDLAPASSSMGSGPVQRLAFLGNAQRRLIYELSVFLSGGYYINQASAKQLSATEVDTHTIRVSPGLRYEFTPDLALDLSYEYTNLNDRCLDTNAQRNMIMLRLYFQWPITL